MKSTQSAGLSAVVAAFAIAVSVWSSDAGAGTTTGLTFDIPAGDTLTNVYVGTAATAGSPGMPLITDILLPPGSGTINSGANLNPPGFTVTGGMTAYNLSTTLFTTAAGNNYFAVLALYTDPSLTEHVVIGTNLNLLGQPYPFDCPGGCTDATYDGWLTTGLLGAGEGTGIEASMFWGMLQAGGFSPFGSTENLWMYTTGTQIVGASVTSNTFGTPVGGSSVPEPGTLLLLSTGLAGIAFARSKRAARPTARRMLGWTAPYGIECARL